MTHAELLAAGYDVDAAAHGRLTRYVSLLLAENRRVNLTSIDDEQDAWVQHVCDSLALLPLIEWSGAQSLLDLGTGGGLPGLPLACVCGGLQVTLLEATRKKLAAVERIAGELRLENVRFAWGRAETLAHDDAYRERFDAVTSRAVAELRVLVEYASGFARVGGECWFFKTPGVLADELAAADPAARRCGLEHAGDHPYRLPISAVDRVIAVYRKRDPLPADLPRAPGRPKKRPL